MTVLILTGLWPMINFVCFIKRICRVRLLIFRLLGRKSFLLVLLRRKIPSLGVPVVFYSLDVLNSSSWRGVQAF